jgi:MEMO1 family protein
MTMRRRAVVAGTFYPGNRERLAAQMEALLPSVQPAPAVGVVVPHAGYMYSGRVAGAVYARVVPPDTWVALGPNHTGQGARAAILCAGEWETPLGCAAIDGELARAILGRSRVLEEDALGHAREHAIEVQLPFWQTRDPAARFVPIALYARDYATCNEVGQAVAAAVRESGRSVILVASTDMSHYVSRPCAAAKDRMALDAIRALDPVRLHQVVREEGIGMCGAGPTAAMLVAACALGASSVELVQYTDSGEVTGDLDEVVAYAGLILRARTGAPEGIDAIRHAV